METILKKIDSRAEELSTLINNTTVDIEAKKIMINESQHELYDLKVKRLRVEEIFRLAFEQFTRLRTPPKNFEGKATFPPSLCLYGDDVAELEKWIGRAKGDDGLKSIIDAIKELRKYKPGEIKTNLYALIQKIIIEGPRDVRRNSR